MHLENLPFNYEEAVAVLLFVIGFCMLLFSRNLIKKVIGLDIMDSGVFLLLADRGYIAGRTAPIIVDGVTDMSRYVNPIPAGLVLTGIVVSVSVSAVMLSLTVRIYKTYRTLDVFLLSVSICMQAALLVFCAVNGTSYSYMMGHYPAPWGNEITVGVLESFMALLFAAVMLMSVLGGMPRIRRDIPEHRMRLYWVMIDLAHVALLALCYTNDIFTAYVFIEVLTIASCCLLAARDGGRPLLAAVRYMIFSLVGSGLFLIGVIFTYSITGQLLFPQLKESVALLWAGGTYRFSMTVAIGLMVGGLAIKSGLFPFHFWMPDTYGRATPASAGILSGVVSKGYIFLLIKIIYQVIGIEVFAASGIQDLLLVLGIGGMVVCSISAIQTGRLRTMIAYSSGAQIGYIYMGLGMGTQAALLAALLQIVAHAVTKPMLFLSGAGLAGASGGHQDFRSLRGAAHRAPAAGVLFTIGALSMVGIPIFAGFIPKLYFATAAAATVGWRVWAVWLALGVSTVLNVLYFLYTAMLIWVPEETEHAQRPKRFSPLPTAGLAAMNLAVGLGSAAVTELFAMGMGLFCG